MPPPAPRHWHAPDGEHLDVRGLAPPQPLVEILRRVQARAAAGGTAGAPAGALFVHHDRDPVLLYPELATLGWMAERLPSAPGEVLLRLEPGP